MLSKKLLGDIKFVENYETITRIHIIFNRFRQHFAGANEKFTERLLGN